MKSFKEILSEARFVSSGAFRITPSGRKVRRRIRVGDDDYNQEQDIDKDGDIDKDDLKKLRKESAELDEATTVKKDNYSWGKMMTVHHGADHSYPLHPEHQEAIKNLKDNEKTHFKDETGTKVTAHREGGDVHFTSNRTAKKTTVSHSHFTESVNKETDDDVPFDKPYKKVEQDVVTDKSGAKHTAMSRARHLARIAFQQQAKKSK